jgi:hypothetical protein
MSGFWTGFGIGMYNHAGGPLRGLTEEDAIQLEEVTVTPSLSGGLKYGLMVEMGNVNNGIGFTMGGLQNSASNALSRTMTYYNSSSLIKPPQVMFKVPNGSVYIPTKFVSNASTVLKYGGRVSGVAGLGITAYQFVDGQITGTEALFDGVFGVAAFFGHVGLSASILYFGGKFAYEQISGSTLFNKPIR